MWDCKSVWISAKVFLLQDGFYAQFLIDAFVAWNYLTPVDKSFASATTC